MEAFFYCITIEYPSPKCITYQATSRPLNINKLRCIFRFSEFVILIMHVYISQKYYLCVSGHVNIRMHTKFVWFFVTFVDQKIFTFVNFQEYHFQIFAYFNFPVIGWCSLQMQVKNIYLQKYGFHILSILQIYKKIKVCKTFPIYNVQCKNFHTNTHINVSNKFFLLALTNFLNFFLFFPYLKYFDICIL